ncbi:MAG: hypothetical protein AAGC47_01735 [Bacteroidota bacterium]
MRLIKFLICLAVVNSTIVSNGQDLFWLDPSPTDVTAPARLYIDLNPETISSWFEGCGNCDVNTFDDIDPETNPPFLWMWFRDGYSRPSETIINNATVNVSNGEWASSNINMMLTQDEDNPNLWYFDFQGTSLSNFYGLPAAELYQEDFNFLVKQKDGSDIGENQEQKTADFGILPEPVGCFEKVCPFPGTFFQDEYFAITYDNNQESSPPLQNMGADEARIWFRYKVNGGGFETLQDETLGTMMFDGDGIFSINMLPEEYFGLSDGDILDEIQVFISKTPIEVPPFTGPISLFPGCPE